MRVAENKVTLSTFSDITAFLKFLSALRPAAPSSPLNTPYAALIIALNAIGERDAESINNFLANRYFLDACGVEQLSGKDELQSWVHCHKTKMTLELNALLPERHFDNTDLFETVQALLRFWSMPTGRQSMSEKYDDTIRQKLWRDGYCVIPSVIVPDLCANARETILQVAAEERDRQRAYLYGNANRFQHIYNIITKGEVFSMLLSHPLVRVIMDDMFDRKTLHQKYYLSSYHANIVPEQGEAQKIHVDSAVPEPLPPWIIRANINFVLEDYTELNGATLCVPGSHHWGRKPGPEDESLLAEQLRPIEAAAGSMVIWHGHLWHKSGHNRSNNNRVALLACFAASFLLEMALEENHFRIMSEEFAQTLPGDLSQVLGWKHGLKIGAT